MIQTKLLLLEYATINNAPKNQLKLDAIHNIKNLLTQINFAVEVVPLENSNKLKTLLISLKCSELTTDEERILDELITIEV